MLFTTSQGLPIYGTTSEDFVPPPTPPPPLGATADAATESAADYLLYSLSLLKEKVHQVESLVGVFMPPPQTQPIPAATAIASLGTLIQDIIATASSMMFSSQQMALATTTSTTGHHHNLGDHDHNKFSQSLGEESGQIFYADPHPADDNINTLAYYYYNTRYDKDGLNNQQTDIAFSDGYSCNRNKEETMEVEQGREVITTREEGKSKDNQWDIIEVEAAAIMAKYTHYCRVCGKGFKRDANLRMHMRAHGEEYKSRAALIKPVSAAANNLISGKSETRMYSCPHEGCKWNLRHAKFQPLKSMVCVKNHYRRSHCPKMYVCRRCNRKRFSVLSDLRTHEKHCGDVKWRCSCGTTFSRKDKLIGHVALFVGHTLATDTDIIGPVAPAKLSS